MKKRSANLIYYRGIRLAAVEQFAATEESLRKLEGVKPTTIEKLVSEVEKRHEKLLKRIDQQIDEEIARDSKG